jgi:PLP dependent protein
LDLTCVEMTDQTIASRLRQVRERIAAAAVRSGRVPEAVQLLAVSKGHPVEAIEQAITAGQQAFGENYLAEAMGKMDAVQAEAAWHMTGHVQSRKAATVVARFAEVHSVDSYALAQRLSKDSLQLGRVLTIYLECNITGEKTKFGFIATTTEQWPKLFFDWQSIARLPGLRVAGLMTMAPFDAEPQTARATFRALRDLRDAAREIPALEPLAGLSMGMSDDFEPAIEEGSTVVRIGRAIFGPRTTVFSR